MQATGHERIVESPRSVGNEGSQFYIQTSTAKEKEPKETIAKLQVVEAELQIHKSSRKDKTSCLREK